MTRVTIDKRVKGQEIQRFLATIPGVQRELKAEARDAYSRAKAIHRSHRLTGASKVFLEKGDIDWHVGISDTASTAKKAYGAAFGVARETKALHKAFFLELPERRRTGRKRRGRGR